VSIDQFLAGSTENATNMGSASEAARMGYVGRLNYNRSDKYLVSAIFRYDGSHKFHQDNRFGFFPSFSAGWRISKEDFFPESSVFNNLKIRGSWGQVGNDRLNGGDFQYLSLFDIRTNSSALGGINQTGLSESTLPNLNVTWETSTDMGFGVDIGLFHKIGIELDVFKKHTTGILIPASGTTPFTFAGKLPAENLGETQNKGFEAMIRYNDNFGDISLNTSLNFTYATSKIIKNSESENLNDYNKLTGRSIGSRNGYIAEGLFQTEEEKNNWARQDQDTENPNSTIFLGDIKYKDLNNDGVIDGDDETIIGKGEVPEFVIGYNLALDYKNIYLTANFQYGSGYTRFVKYQPFPIEGNSRSALVDSWRPGNEDAAFPRLSVSGSTNNDLVSTFWLKEISYLRLRNLQLGYNMSFDFLKEIGIEDLKLYVSGNNVFTISNVPDVDPEGPSNDRPYYPQMQTFSLGLNLTL